MTHGPDDRHSHKLAPEEVIRIKVKAELRKRLRGVRKTTPIEACEARSRAIVDRLEEHDAMKAAKRVALFWPIVARHEVDLRPLDARLRQRSVRVAYPTIDPETGAMSFRFVDDPATHLEERGYGFMEPVASAPEATELDVVVVPAIAVDPIGHRIGYGAGYYDRTLPQLAPPAVSIVVAFDWQLVAEVPFTEGDVRCMHVVTDMRAIDARTEPPGA
ncbi:MAG: 5-formyltetrahydrofolate cyclo-ligase [Deltaproteobacteria bacterium]|nr:5-formyltetrahydrofolate cyclo-ligase [Deltaproteobacteria bacterium]